MPLIVLSPYSGLPVRVREEDLGRTVRDESGRVFYPLKRPDAEGYYASATRHGSPRDLQKYLELLSRQAAHQSGGAGVPPAASSAPAANKDPAAEGLRHQGDARPETRDPRPETTSSVPVHDATGRPAARRARYARRILIALACLAAGALAGWLWFGVFHRGHGG